MNKKFSGWIWDIGCIASFIGIWPRYIEPILLQTCQLSLSIPDLPDELVGLKIAQFSDLHWNENFSSYFLNKLKYKINSLEADLLVFTGDFISCSLLEKKTELLNFLNSLKAKFGCFAVLGNHDYEKFVTINQVGDYDVKEADGHSQFYRTLRYLFTPNRLTKQVTERVKSVSYQEELIELLEKTPFKLLRNECQLVACRGSWLNICGLEEYMLGRCSPEQAFKSYDAKHLGLILSHNPDSLPLLANYPGDLVLCGHTHGCQINLPFLRDRLTRLENSSLKKGLKRVMDKWVYINRGVASVMRFRCLSLPELTQITLRK